MNVIFVWKVWKACSSSWKRLCILTSKLNTRLLHSKSLRTFSFKNIVHLIVIFHHIYYTQLIRIMFGWTNQHLSVFLSISPLRRLSFSLFLSLHRKKEVELQKWEIKRDERKTISFRWIRFYSSGLFSFWFSFIIFRLQCSGVGKHWHLLWVYVRLFNFPQKRNHFHCPLHLLELNPFHSVCYFHLSCLKTHFINALLINCSQYSASVYLDLEN